MSLPLPTTSMASRDTLSCSWPVASISASSVIAGTCRKSRSASKRRCSKRAGRPGQLRGPADLALDLADELSDLASGGFRLLALDAHQRGLLFLIGEIDVERAVGDQRQAHHGDEQKDIFNKQPAAHDGAGSGSPGVRRSTHAFVAAFRRRSHMVRGRFRLSRDERNTCLATSQGKPRDSSFYHLVGANQE